MQEQASTHPRPQFRRARWQSLDGAWAFADDPGDEGEELGWVDQEFGEQIVVPFARETPASGLHRRGRMLAVWYRRTVAIPPEWAGQRVLLHCQAVDHEATVWVNGVQLITHRGGYTPFAVDITDHLTDGAAVVVIRARDDWRRAQPRGKQSRKPLSQGCHYQRTTGIWQTVWLEPVPATRFERPAFLPDAALGGLRCTLPLHGPRRGMRCTVRLLADGATVTEATFAADAGMTPQCALAIPAEHRRWWSPADPFLYDIELELHDAAGALVDRAESYAGLRSVACDGNRFLLNGEPIFQRLVLDQGYWPDTGLTPPSDEELVADIQRAQACGFDGARVHERVADERFLYHADRLGFLLWGEFADWGLIAQADRVPERAAFPVDLVDEWLAVIERDRSHPSIILWCPFNEAVVDDRHTDPAPAIATVVRATRLADPTRPVLDNSGWGHCQADADIYDYHDYKQDPAVLDEHARALRVGETPQFAYCDVGIPYGGQPCFVSECGGARFPPQQAGWGYGDDPPDEDAFIERFAGICGALLANPLVAGYCYTQLTDVEQERNGLFTFHRAGKFPVQRLFDAQRRPAAQESDPCD